VGPKKLRASKSTARRCLGGVEYGRNVERVRQEKGLTQEQLAELSGFSQQYISGLEQGRRNPTIVSLYELATALGVSHMELVRSAEDE